MESARNAQKTVRTVSRTVLNAIFVSLGIKRPRMDSVRRLRLNFVIDRRKGSVQTVTLNSF